MNKLSLRDLDLKGKRVLMRVDFNVPLDDQGAITDDTRIVASLPSIQYVLDHGGTLILMSHLGRPKGVDPKLSLAPCAKRLSELLKRPVTMTPGTSDVVLLENLRFNKGEENPEKDPDFVKGLAALGDLYVNDAFGTAHRAHASTTVIASYFPNKAAAGFLLEKEIHFLQENILHPKRPFFAVIGGAKVSSKIGVLKALLQKVDGLLIGGGMAYTFLKARGIPIGNSLCEDSYLSEIKDLPCLLPIDHLVVKDGTATVVDKIPDGYVAVDIGPKTIQAFTEALQGAATVFWNGPLGITEVPAYAKGTLAMAIAISSLNAITIVGGGDSVAAVQSMGLGEKFSYLSTGGGAALEFIEFGTLPGIEALSTY